MHCRLRQLEHLAHMVLCIMDTTFSIECQMFQAVYLLRFIGRRNFIHLTVHLELSIAFNWNLKMISYLRLQPRP